MLNKYEKMVGRQTSCGSSFSKFKYLKKIQKDPAIKNFSAKCSYSIPSFFFGFCKAVSSLAAIPLLLFSRIFSLFSAVFYD